MRPMLLILMIVAILSLANSAAGGEWTLECLVHGERLEGMPLAWSNRSVELLTRDGAWRTIALDEATDYRKLGDAALIARDRAFIQAVQSRVRALKREGKSIDEAAAAVVAEIAPRYPEFGNPANAAAVARAAFNEAQ